MGGLSLTKTYSKEEWSLDCNSLKEGEQQSSWYETRDQRQKKKGRETRSEDTLRRVDYPNWALFFDECGMSSSYFLVFLHHFTPVA